MASRIGLHKKTDDVHHRKLINFERVCFKKKSLVLQVNDIQLILHKGFVIKLLNVQGYVIKILYSNLIKRDKSL